MKGVESDCAADRPHFVMNAISAKFGGIATYTRNLIKELDARGVPAMVHVPKGAGFEPGSQGHVSVVPQEAAYFGAVSRLVWEQTRWRFLVKKSCPQVVFSSANYAVLGLKDPPQVLLLREGGLFNPVYRRLVMRQMSMGYRIEGALRRWLMLASARSAQKIMFPSETMRDWFLSSAPDLAERAVVNPYGTYVENFVTDIRRNWCEDGVLRTLFVAVYYPHKDPLTMARAAALLDGQGLRTEARITMEPEQFGLWPIGRVELKALLSAEFSRVVKLGRIPYADLPAGLANADAVVFPSVSETFGHPLVEAMAAGKPIVAADTLINREVCGPAALYFPPGDHDVLAARLRDLDRDPGLRAWMSGIGQQRARERFTWARHVDRLLEIMKCKKNTLPDRL